jgi:glycosyltransferase involved in cell wall biosynthesis
MKLSIVIPAKNEEQRISNLLDSLSKQSFTDFDIIIADAGSSDRTTQLAKSHKISDKVSIVDGGLPAKGRNNGAKHSRSEILLFIDADISFQDKDLIRKSIDRMEKDKLDLVTTHIKCRNNKIVNFIYKINNILQTLSRLNKPFSTGMFFMIRSKAFNELGGFDEMDIYAEDYHLSRKVHRKRFGIIDSSCVYSDDRRFKKMGYLKIIGLFLKTIIYRNNDSYYKKRIEYHD